MLYQVVLLRDCFVHYLRVQFELENVSQSIGYVFCVQVSSFKSFRRTSLDALTSLRQGC
jgi:hypothetical protein